MPKAPYTLVRFTINPKHGTADGVLIDGTNYPAETLFVVDAFEYPVIPQSKLVKGVSQIEYPFGGEARVRHFTRKRPWADMWLLSDGRNLTPVASEAPLLDEGGWFYVTERNIPGAPGIGQPDVWPGPSVRCVRMKPGQKVTIKVERAPAEILVYEHCAGVEFDVSGSANYVRAHGNRGAVTALDCADSNTVRLNVTSQGVAFRSDRCAAMQNVFGSARGLLYLGDAAVVDTAGRGYATQGRVNVCCEFIGGMPGGIRDWAGYGQRSGVRFDDFATSSSVKNPVIYDLDIGVEIGGGWNHTIKPVRCSQVTRPIANEDRSRFVKEIAAWGIVIPDPRKNRIYEPASYDSADWLYASPHFADGSVVQ